MPDKVCATFDIVALVSQVAAYSAGPAERLWRYFVLDTECRLPALVEDAGWRSLATCLARSR